MSEITQSKDGVRNSQLIVVGGQFILKHCIYRGKSHNLYLALRQGNHESFYVVRLVSSSFENQYIEEEKMLKKLADIQQIPQIIQQGEVRLQSSLYQYQAFQKYGPSLKLCFQYMNKAFTLQTVALIAIQLLNTLEKIHSQLVVHRNLKPKKILTHTIGAGSRNCELLLIDFKHASKYKHKNGKYLGGNENKKFSTQTLLNKFSSINVHLGLIPSPKDDLESLGYILIYLLRQGDLFKSKEQGGSKIKKMEENKLKIIPEKLCKGMPIEILQYFQYVRMTNISQFPLQDYEFLRKLFRNILQQLNISEKEAVYDWTKKMAKEQETKIVVNKSQSKFSVEGIPEAQTEAEKSSIRKKQEKKLYKQLSSVCWQDSEEEDQKDNVSRKMLKLPLMDSVIQIKNS